MPSSAARRAASLIAAARVSTPARSRSPSGSAHGTISAFRPSLLGGSQEGLAVTGGHVGVRGDRGQAGPGQPGGELVGAGQDAERLDVREAHGGDPVQRPVEILGTDVVPDAVELDAERR